MIVAVLTTFLNSAFPWRRDEQKRTREAAGLLQRTRSLAMLLLGALQEFEHAPDTRIERAVDAVRGLSDAMLATEFATTTADLGLDEAYRGLERINGAVDAFVENGKHVQRLANDPRTMFWINPDNDEENPEYDAEWDEERRWVEDKGQKLAKAMEDDTAVIVEIVTRAQAKLPLRMSWWRLF